MTTKSDDTPAEKTQDEPVDPLRFYTPHASPPQEFTKEIRFGHLRGKTDINPQWRIACMTRMFGPIGIGWWYDILQRRVEEMPVWSEEASAVMHEKVVFYTLRVAYVEDGVTSHGIFGTGGAAMIYRDKNGWHLDDDAEKKAITDALSVCFKQIGIASDVYAGLWDESKFQDDHGGKRPGARPGAAKEAKPKEKPPSLSKAAADSLVTTIDTFELHSALLEFGKTKLKPTLPPPGKSDHADRVWTAYKQKAEELNPVPDETA